MSYIKAIEISIEETKRITDKLGHRVDKKILRPVAILRALGFPTTMSCEGHLDWGYNYPWIEINLGRSDGVVAVHKYWKLKLKSLMEIHKPELYIQDMTPVSGFGGFRLCGLGLYLDVDQESMADFCEKIKYAAE